MRTSWILGGVAAALLAGGFVFVFERPISVRGVIEETDVPLRIYGLGTVEARVLSKVGFEVGGALVKLAADAGDMVDLGQEIASLNPMVQEARTARAKAALISNAAALAKAEAGYKRVQSVLEQQRANNRRQQELVGQNVVSSQRAEEAQRDEDIARADLSVAEAEIAVVRALKVDAEALLRQEQAQLAQYRLNAPYHAVIITRHVEAGAVVKAGDPIFTMIDPTTVWIQAFIDEERAGQLDLNQPATILLRSKPQSEFNGQIIRIGLESDRVNEERRIWLVCNDCPAQMYLGEQAEVRVLTDLRKTALMVPETAISAFDGRGGKVWIVQSGRMAQIDVKFGARDDRGRVEYRSGLPEGATIIADPSTRVRAGRMAKIEARP